MSDQNRNACDTSDRRPDRDYAPSVDPTGEPGIVVVDGRGLISSWNMSAAALLANAGTLLALEMPFGRLESEARQSCGIAFRHHSMADGGLICLCEPLPSAAGQAPRRPAVP